MKVKKLKFKIKNYQKGFAVFFITFFIVAVISEIAASISVFTYIEQKISQNIIQSSRAYYIAEAGIEDSIYRIIKNKNYETNNSLEIGEGTATINIIEEYNKRIIVSEGRTFSKVKKIKTVLVPGSTDISFHYGAQIGQGGLIILPNTKVIGNVYSNGNITGSGIAMNYSLSCPNSASCITGDAWVAGGAAPITYLVGTWIGVDAHANSIINSNITRDAYYQIIDETTKVWGTKYPESPDPAAEDLPISYGQIEEWEKAACCDTGDGCKSECVITPPGGTYAPAPGSVLGPLKINGSLTFPNNSDDNPVTITGPIWATGKISASNNAGIKLKEDLESGYPIIADNPLDQDNGGKIVFQNNVITVDNPQGGKLLFISTNKSISPTDPAIWFYNNVNKDNAQSIIFSLQGLIKIENNVKFKQVTGYSIYLSNNAEIVYEEGLINSNFSSGPGGGWEAVFWNEIE